MLTLHAGGGLYRPARRLVPEEGGVRRRHRPTRDERPSEPPWPLSWRVIEEMNSDGQLHYYPACSELPRRLIREQDKLALMELHNNEVGGPARQHT